MVARHEYMTDSSGPSAAIPPMTMTTSADDEIADAEARAQAWMERARAAEEAFVTLLREQAQRHEQAQRSDHQVLVSVAQLLEEQLAELKHVNARVSAGESRSSASVKSSARGYDLDCKSYADGLEHEALDNAIAMYARGMRELDALKANDWRQTVDAEQAKREAVAP